MLPIHSSPDELEPTLVGSKRTATIDAAQVPSVVGPQFTMSEYFSRMFKYTQMDFDYTFAQMVYLCLSPNKVYQLTQYRKRTKGLWSRDDPCFIVLQGFFLAMAGWAYGICFGESMVDQLRTFCYFFFLHFVVVGVLVSSTCIVVADKYLRKKGSVHGVVQPMDWL